MIQETQKPQLNIPVVSGMSLDELHIELNTQEILYSAEKDVNKANQANWRMTVLLNEICKLKRISQMKKKPICLTM
jgi:hypothetical protein